MTEDFRTFDNSSVIILFCCRYFPGITSKELLDRWLSHLHFIEMSCLMSINDSYLNPLSFWCASWGVGQQWPMEDFSLCNLIFTTDNHNTKEYHIVSKNVNSCIMCSSYHEPPEGFFDHFTDTVQRNTSSHQWPMKDFWIRCVFIISVSRLLRNSLVNDAFGYYSVNLQSMTSQIQLTLYRNLTGVWSKGTGFEV